MSTFVFQANAAHARNIRRACTERRAQEHMLTGVHHQPYLRHSKSSEARLDQLAANNGELCQDKHHLHLTQQQQSKSENCITKAPSNENISTAFTRPEAWKLTFGSNDGGLKIPILTVSNDLCQSIVAALQSFGDMQ